ncbi:MAG: MoaD/ThiS family protein [Thermodesulfobacteriota bacterium]
MEIKVRLYGALGKGLPGHDPLKGMLLDLPEGSRVGDLINHLKIPRKKVGIISVDGSLVKDTKTLHDGNFVRLYRPIFGG